MTKGNFRFWFTDIRSHGDGFPPTPSPHTGPPVFPGRMVDCPAAPHPIGAAAGSQQSWAGLKPTEPSPFVPPPADGQVIEDTKPVIPQDIVAAVGMALIAVEPSPCILNCPSNVSRVQVSWMRPTPTRRTVVPLPFMSQAKPARGSKSWASGFHIVLYPACPC